VAFRAACTRREPRGPGAQSWLIDCTISLGLRLPKIIFPRKSLWPAATSSYHPHRFPIHFQINGAGRRR
jgi:hypothetical protein